MPRPRDVTCERPTILFVGINPSTTSGKVGHHFAGPGNPFYRLLHAAQLIPEPITAADDQRLAEWGLALVNLVGRPTRMASDLSRSELQRGRARLLAKIRAMQPAVVALVGVTLAPIVLGGKAGPGPTEHVLGGARVFVVPNPSGLNASYPSFAAKLRWFEQLRAFATRDADRPTRRT